MILGRGVEYRVEEYTPWNYGWKVVETKETLEEATDYFEDYKELNGMFRLTKYEVLQLVDNTNQEGPQE